MSEPDAGRLVVAAVLRLHMARTLGPQPLDRGLDASGLRDVAARLQLANDPLERLHGLVLTPTYPGVTAGVEEVRGGTRLVLVCDAVHRGRPAAVVVTTLVPGRVPQVTAAPPESLRSPGAR